MHVRKKRWQDSEECGFPLPGSPDQGWFDAATANQIRGLRVYGKVTWRTFFVSRRQLLKILYIEAPDLISFAILQLGSILFGAQSEDWKNETKFW